MFLALNRWHFHKYKTYRKIPKISPQGLYFSKALFEGLSFEGAYNVQREICVSKLIGLACSGKKFAIFALFYFVLKGKYQVQVPGGGDLTDGFLRYDFGGLIIGGAYFRNSDLPYAPVLNSWFLHLKYKSSNVSTTIFIYY